jgi:hypothetical protein
MIPLFALSPFLRTLLFGSTVLPSKNVALRHQLAVLQRSFRRARLSRWDRIFCLGFSASSSLGPTVLACAPPGLLVLLAVEVHDARGWRPRLDAEIRHLIRRMARGNPWGRRGFADSAFVLEECDPLSHPVLLLVSALRTTARRLVSRSAKQTIFCEAGLILAPVDSEHRFRPLRCRCQEDKSAPKAGARWAKHHPCEASASAGPVGHASRASHIPPRPAAANRLIGDP